MYDKKTNTIKQDFIRKAFGFNSLSFNILPDELKSNGIARFNGDILGNKTPFTDNKYFIVGKQYYTYNLFDTEYAIDESNIARPIRKMNWEKIY